MASTEAMRDATYPIKPTQKDKQDKEVTTTATTRKSTNSWCICILLLPLAWLTREGGYVSTLTRSKFFYRIRKGLALCYLLKQWRIGSSFYAGFSIEGACVA